MTALMFTTTDAAGLQHASQATEPTADGLVTWIVLSIAMFGVCLGFRLAARKIAKEVRVALTHTWSDDSPSDLVMFKFPKDKSETLGFLKTCGKMAQVGNGLAIALAVWTISLNLLVAPEATLVRHSGGTYASSDLQRLLIADSSLLLVFAALSSLTARHWAVAGTASLAATHLLFMTLTGLLKIPSLDRGSVGQFLVFICVVVLWCGPGVLLWIGHLSQAKLRYSRAPDVEAKYWYRSTPADGPGIQVTYAGLCKILARIANSSALDSIEMSTDGLRWRRPTEDDLARMKATEARV
jgi:hypothetical protein